MNTELNFTEEMFRPVEGQFKQAEKLSRPTVSYWADVWRRLRKNKLAMLGLIIIILSLLQNRKA